MEVGERPWRKDMWDEEKPALGRNYGTATLKEACKGHGEKAGQEIREQQ